MTAYRKGNGQKHGKRRVEAWVKKDDRLDEKNHRPITLLCTVDKVCECTVEWTGTVNWHFNTVLDTSLYYSLCCILAYQFIEKNQSCEATFIDGCRFQAICRSTFKLNAYGFAEGPLKLIRSYFTSRKNRVKLDSVVSDWKEGSSFGPLLWNIF